MALHFVIKLQRHCNGIILVVFKWSVNKLPPSWSLECCIQHGIAQCYQQLLFLSPVLYMLILAVESQVGQF